MIKQLREHLLLSQHDVAYKLKITLQTYARLEEENSPDFRRKVYDTLLSERIKLIKLLRLCEM